LCDAVTGRGDSQALLEQVERAGLFLVPLDDVRGWWRYHHLFAELLRARLGQPSERAAALHHNAAAWYERHGLADDAIGHAVAAGEMVWAARIIEKYFDEFYFLRGEVATIRQWLSALPADLIRSRVRLLLAQAHMAATSGRGEAVEPLLDAAERAPAGSGEDPFESSAGQAASWLVNPRALTILLRSYLATLRGDAESTAELASRGRAEIRAGEWMLSYTADGLLADAEWLRGRLASAERMFVPRLARWREAGVPTMMAWVCDELTQIQRAQGHLDEAARTGRQVLEITELPSGAHLAAAGSAYVALADVAYQRNDLETALHDVTEGIALCRQFVYAPPLARGLATLAWIRQANGDPAGAREAMAEAAHAAPGPVGLVNPAPALRARLLLAQGDVTAGVRFVQENRLAPDDEPNFAREAGYLVLARVLLAQGRSAQALALLDRLHTAAAAQDRVGSVIEVGALGALARSAAGDEPGAVMALAGTLTLACPQGYVRVFADEGAPMAALLGRLIAAQRTTRAVASVTLGYLARLQRAFDVGPPAPDRGPPGIVDPLTSREFEVLEMLAAGRSNQAIARELVVTLDTVKKHVGHVLGKLGAANRTEAVARARELNLIP
jgi:LuxR family maltose regulon positive regulatory protein